MKKIFAVAVIVSVFFLMGLSTLASAAPVTMRFSCSFPAHNFMTKQALEWAQLVEKNSGGELKVQVFDSAQLYKDPDLPKAVMTGAVDGGLMGSLFMGTGLIPSIRVFQMPFLIQTVDDMTKIYHSKIGERWKAEAEKKGIKLMGLVVHPSPEDQLIASVKPIKVPADIKGMAIRISGPDDAAVVKKWGASPTPVPGMDVYPALQRGTLQGAIGSIANQVDGKRYEVAPYAVYLPLAGAQAYYAINKDFFDKLNPKQQKALVDASDTMEKKSKKLTFDQVAKDREVLKEKMKGLHTPTAQEMALWKEGVADMWPQLVGNNKELAETLKEARALLGR
ncbi:MAG TPA: TRAP transporter substrate-binding protein [Syntrophorhabdaceae bacterium]|nr:TRAP transporter substrate-binding protein [Syntrophorhabdaceae bacterium]